MERYYFKDLAGQTIYLTFEPKLFSANPGHVLVVPIYRGKFVFTCHETRGWELPGGKVEPNESPAEAAAREVWEETGAVLEKTAVQIGEYTVEDEQGDSFHKAIFVAHVESLLERPDGFETIDVTLFPISIDPRGEEFSPLMKDQVFLYIREMISTQYPPAT
jgi:8-oxo-dGTP diphosphatase